MPTDDPSIGFNNIWYPGGFEYAQNFTLLDGNIIRILTAPYSKTNLFYVSIFIFYDLL